MMPPRATSVPRTRMTYSCESRPTSSRMRTGGMTMPSSEAIWRRIVPTRCSSVPPAFWSTIGTRPKPIASSSGSSASASSAASRGAAAGSSPAAARRGRRGRGRGVAALFGCLAQRPADGEEQAADDQERDLRQRRDEREAHDHDAGDERRLALLEDLARDVGAEVLLGRRARDEDAGGDRDQQRGDLRAQAVADRQQGEVLGGLAERHALLHDADDDAADEVDAGDEDAGHRVALDELRGTVHRAVEVGLLGDLGAALARLLVGDLAGVEVGVDRHLLARHGVEGEAGAHLGHAAGAVRDDDELDDDQDQEDDEADDHVAADDELAERGDDVAGVAVQQDQARDRDVDRQAEQRGEQQEARERA